MCDSTEPTFNFLRHRILMLDGGSRLNIYPGITVRHIYRQHLSRLGKLAFKIAEHLKFADEYRWYNDWRERVAEFDTIIIFDGIRSSKLLEFIKRNNPTARIILYYVNPFDENSRNAPHLFRRFTDEIYTFDRAAAAKHNLIFKPFFYEYEREANAAIAKNLPIEYDALFFGADKGRLPTLLKLKATLDASGLTAKISVRADKRRRYSDREKKYLFNGWFDYIKIAEETAKSRAIIDITQHGQSGITLRPLEAVFMQKKLITDNADIVHYNFYNDKNIFLLGKDNIAGLPAFINSGFVPVDDAILKDYRQETWIEGFFL